MYKLKQQFLVDWQPKCNGAKTFVLVLDIVELDYNPHQVLNGLTVAECREFDPQHGIMITQQLKACAEI